jgi:HK97 gp10 family phage protein
VLDVVVNIDIGELDQLSKDIKQAHAAAVREVARTLIVPAAKNALSFQGEHAPVGQLGTRTGKTRAQVKPKFWTGKDGLLDGTVKVIGDRAHISRFNEAGTKSHGPGGKRGTGKNPLPARKMFETVSNAQRVNIENAIAAAFERNMKAKGYK